MTTAETAVPLAAPPARTELSTKVTPIQALRQTLTLSWRTIVQVRHDPKELAGISFQPIIWILLFTYVFGGAISGSRHAYLQFMVPGMMVMSMLFATLNVGQGLNTDLSRGVFDRMRALPIARWAPFAGRIAGDQLKQLWAIGLIFVVGMILGYRPAHVVGVVGGFLLLLLFAACFSWIAVLVGVSAKNGEKVQIFGFAAILPLNFASGVFVPTSTMPGWLQAFAKVSPVAMLLRAVRGMMNGGPVANPLFWSLVWSAVFVAIFAPLSIRAFKRRV